MYRSLSVFREDFYYILHPGSILVGDLQDQTITSGFKTVINGYNNFLAKTSSVDKSAVSLLCPLFLSGFNFASSAQVDSDRYL